MGIPTVKSLERGTVTTLTLHTFPDNDRGRYAPRGHAGTGVGHIAVLRMSNRFV